MSQSNFLICYDYAKNNSYINFGDANHIRTGWSCSNAVKTHNVSYISLKNFGSLSSIAKTLIKLNSNSFKENDEEEKEPIVIEFTVQKADLENDKNDFDFGWLGVQEEDEEDIALANFIKN